MMAAQGMPADVKLMFGWIHHHAPNKKASEQTGGFGERLESYNICAIFSDQGSMPYRVSLIFFPARQSGKSDCRTHRRPAAPLPIYWVRCRR